MGAQERLYPWYGWRIVFTGAAINVVLGSWYSWSVIGKAIAREWGWTQAQAGLPFAIATVSFSLTMIVAGRVQDSYGPRVVAVAGGLLLGCAMLISSLSQDPQAIALTYGVMGGCGIAVGYSGTVPAALKWFPPQRKGLVAGIVVAGVGLAAVFISPLTSYLLSALGIAGTFRVLGVGTIVLVALLGMVLRNPPDGYRPPGPPGVRAQTSAAPTPVASGERDWREVLMTPQFYAIWVMFVLSAAPGLMIIANAVQILSVPEQQTFNPVLAPMVIALFSTCGRVLGGYVSDWIGRRRTLVAVFLLQGVNVGCLSLYSTQPQLLGAFALAGLLYGAFFPLLPAMMADFYGLRHLGVNYGMVGTAFGASGITGILLGGYVKDLLRSYDLAYWIFAAMLGSAALLAVAVRAPRRG